MVLKIIAHSYDKILKDEANMNDQISNGQINMTENDSIEPTSNVISFQNLTESKHQEQESKELITANENTEIIKINENDLLQEQDSLNSIGNH